MKKGFIIVVFCCLAIISIKAQDVIDSYVQEGLKSNIALKQKEYSYQKSLEELKEARRMFFPVVSVEAKYSRNEGGRTIDLPYGDLLNPVYNNLNAVNELLGQINPQYGVSTTYPELEN